MLTWENPRVSRGLLGKSISRLKLVAPLKPEPKEHLKNCETHALPLV